MRESTRTHEAFVIRGCDESEFWEQLEDHMNIGYKIVNTFCTVIPKEKPERKFFERRSRFKRRLRHWKNYPVHEFHSAHLVKPRSTTDLPII